MEYRNAKFLVDGRIDCEVNHPNYGWIPYTAAPNDLGADLHSAMLYEALAGDPSVEPYVPPSEEELARKAEEALAKTRSEMKLSFSQLLIGLVQEQWVTETEGELWLDGELPEQVRLLISTLPASQQFAAKARAKRPSEVSRSDPLVNALAAFTGKGEEELDQFFTTYAQV